MYNCRRSTLAEYVLIIPEVVLMFITPFQFLMPANVGRFVAGNLQDYCTHSQK